MNENPKFHEPAPPVGPLREIAPQRRGSASAPRSSANERSGWVELPSGQEIVAAVVVVVFLLGFPWLNPGYRYLSLAITTGITSIALYGLGIQFGQPGIISVGHAAFIGIAPYTPAILPGNPRLAFPFPLPSS